MIKRIIDVERFENISTKDGFSAVLVLGRDQNNLSKITSGAADLLDFSTGSPRIIVKSQEWPGVVDKDLNALPIEALEGAGGRASIYTWSDNAGRSRAALNNAQILTEGGR